MKRKETLLSIIGLSLFLSLACPATTVERTATIESRPDADSVDQDRSLTVHFIDVGGGDTILIDTPSNMKIMIDGGWHYNDRYTASAEYDAYLDEFLGDDDVDLLIISHADYDHVAGLQRLVEADRVRQIWYTGYHHDDLSQTWDDLLEKIQETDELLFVSPITDYFGLGSTIRFDDSGTYKKSDDVVLTLINAKRSLGSTAYGSTRTLNEGKRRNSSSLVVRLDYGNTSFLFTGDTNGRNRDSDDQSECDDQELFMARNNDNSENPLCGKLDCTVLKVAHHGSNGSSSLRFLRAVKPEWAVISAGVQNEHPHDSVLERLKYPDVGLDDEHILRTDDGDPSGHSGTEANLGDECYQFLVDPTGIVKIEKWNVTVD